MIYDLVLALNGYIGDLVVECVDPAGYCMREEALSHLAESEKLLVDSLLNTGYKYRRLHDFCTSVWGADVSLLAACIEYSASLASKLEPKEPNFNNEPSSKVVEPLFCHRGYYVHAMVNTINVHLENYARHLRELQKIVLAYPDLPIATLVVAMQPHADVIEVLHRLVYDTYIPMALEKKQKGHLLLCMLRHEGKSGVYKSVCDNLHQSCLQVFGRQLKFWLSAGILDDPYDEFIIQMRPMCDDCEDGCDENNRVYEWNFKYNIDWKQLGIWDPHDTSRGPILNVTCANDVLYLGKIAAIYGKSHFAFDKELNLDEPKKFAHLMLQCRRLAIAHLGRFPDVAKSKGVIKYLDHVYKGPNSEVLFDLAENAWKLMLEPYTAAAFKRLIELMSHHRNFKIRRNLFGFRASGDNLLALGRVNFAAGVELDENAQVWQHDMVQVANGFKSTFTWRVNPSGKAVVHSRDDGFCIRGGIAMVLQSRLDPAVAPGHACHQQRQQRAQEQRCLYTNESLVIRFNLLENTRGIIIDLVVSIGDERMAANSARARIGDSNVIVVAGHTFDFGFSQGCNPSPGSSSTLVRTQLTFSFDRISIACHCYGDFLCNTQTMRINTNNLGKLLPLEIGNAYIGLVALESRIDLDRWTFKSTLPLDQNVQGAKGWNIVLAPNSKMVPQVEPSILVELNVAFQNNLLKQRCSAALASGLRLRYKIDRCNLGHAGRIFKICLKLRDHLARVAPALYNEAPVSCNAILANLAVHMGKFATLYHAMIYRHVAIAIRDPLGQYSNAPVDGADFTGSESRLESIPAYETRKLVATW